MAKVQSYQPEDHGEHTGSCQITVVKQRWARIVLGWQTAWELRVPLAFFIFIFHFYFFFLYFFVAGVCLFLISYLPHARGVLTQ